MILIRLYSDHQNIVSSLWISGLVLFNNSEQLQRSFCKCVTIYLVSTCQQNTTHNIITTSSQTSHLSTGILRSFSSLGPVGCLLTSPNMLSRALFAAECLIFTGQRVGVLVLGLEPSVLSCQETNMVLVAPCIASSQERTTNNSSNNELKPQQSHHGSAGIPRHHEPPAHPPQNNQAAQAQCDERTQAQGGGQDDRKRRRQASRAQWGDQPQHEDSVIQDED